MPRVKSLSDVYIRQQPIFHETAAYLNLYIVSSQMDRLKKNREAFVERIEQIDKRLNLLKNRCGIIKNAIRSIAGDI